MHRFAVAVIALVACSKTPAIDPIASEVPADTALVATVSLDRLRLSTFWPKLEAALAAKLPLAAIRASCPSDPVRSIESIAIALPTVVAPDRALVFVRGVTRDVAAACMTELARNEGQPIQISEAGPLVQMSGDGDVLYARWLGARTLVFAPGAMHAKEPLLAVGKPATRDPAFATALGKLRRDRVLSFAFRAPAQTELRSLIADSGVEPEWGYGWLDLDTVLRGEIVLGFATAEAAAAAAKQTFEGPLARARTIARDREVTLTLELDAAQTSQLIELALSTGN
jgi:hypothetical protein